MGVALRVTHEPRQGFVCACGTRTEGRGRGMTLAVLEPSVLLRAVSGVLSVSFVGWAARWELLPPPPPPIHTQRPPWEEPFTSRGTCWHAPLLRRRPGHGRAARGRAGRRVARPAAVRTKTQKTAGVGGTRRNQRPRSRRGEQSGCPPSCRAERSHAARQLAPKRAEHVSTHEPAALFTATRASTRGRTGKCDAVRPHDGVLSAGARRSAETRYRTDDP